MPRGVSARPSSSYPKEYMQIFHHVLGTGKHVVVSSLGTERGPYTSLRQQMNTWRRRLYEEGSPLAAELYAITTTIDQQVINGKKQYVLIIRPRDARFEQALKGLVPDDQTDFPSHVPNPPPAVQKAPEAEAGGGAPAGTAAIADIFGKKE